jgi:3-deoxy-D-manno-octulosonic acid kinase
MFDPRALAERGAITGQAPGRGSTLFLQLGGRALTLRHFRRGGWMAPLLGDRYLWIGLRRTRATRELALLAQLHSRGLPVPRPVAARVCRAGCVYRGDIITERIAHAQSLAARLGTAALAGRDWRALGSVLRRFHRAGVYHADLNAHNIVQDAAGRFYLVDFDRGRLRAPARGWRGRNLARLRLSLDKLTAERHPFYFSDPDWAELLAGYAPLPGE